MSSKGCQDYHLFVWIYGKTRDIKKCLKMPTKMWRDIRTMALQGHYMYTFFDPFLAQAQRSKRLLFSQGTRVLRQPTASVVPRLRSLGKFWSRDQSGRRFWMDVLGIVSVCRGWKNVNWRIRHDAGGILNTRILVVDWWLKSEILKHFSLIVCSTVYRVWFVLSVVHEWNSNNSISRSEGKALWTDDLEWTREKLWEIPIQLWAFRISFYKTAATDCSRDYTICKLKHFFLVEAYRSILTTQIWFLELIERDLFWGGNTPRYRSCHLLP